MSLNIMIAGCSKDERERIEAAVRAAFNGRPDEGPWNVSLVNVANQWSVDIDGPEPRFKGLSIVAPTGELTSSLQAALGSAAPVQDVAAAPPINPPAGNGTSPAAATGGNGVPAHAGGARTDRHQCEECAAAFEVIFDQQAGEPEELCPVACPACWHVNKVPIAEAAGATGDYRAQAV